MGFEVTSDGAVAQLLERPTSVPPSSHATQVPVKSAGSAASRAVADRPLVAPTNSRVAGGAAVTDAKVSVTAVADGQEKSLYKIIRQRSKMKLSSDEEQSKALSSDAADTRNVDVDDGQHPQREPSVKFCLENNAFISASSAEESQCR